MDWMLELVGKEYGEGGSGPEIFDCYGLARWVIRRGFGIELPQRPIGWRRYGIVLDYPCRIMRYDMLFFAAHNDLGLTDHLGVAIDSRDMIHADYRFRAVVCEPIRKYRNIISIGRISSHAA